VLLGNQQDIRELYGIEKVSKPGAPLILVPTSAGTGSEVTDIAILSDEAAQLKMGIVSRHMLPASVILDPELTLSLPKGPTAASGMDALIHAMEAYTSIHATPLTDMWAEHAIALIAPNLRKAWARGEDIQARQAMLTGSFYAGVAFCNAGVTAVHAFAYPIGARYHIPHGLANTLMLLPVFRFNMVGNMERFARLAAMLGENTTGLSPEKAAGRCLDALERSALTPLPGLSDRQAASHTHHCPDQTTCPTALAVMQVPFFCSRGPQPKAKQRHTRHPGYALPFHALPV